MHSEIISAFILGLIGGAIPGPVLAATFTEILQSGFWKSFRIILWGMFSETIVAVTTLLILSSIGLPESVFQSISIIGAGILIWIASSVWKIRAINTAEKVSFSPGKVFVMILANGALWTFWITACVPKAIALGEKVAFGQFIFLVLVEIGWLVSTTLVAIMFLQFRTTLSNPKIVPIAFKVVALTFIYFALDMAYGSLKFFL